MGISVWSTFSCAVLLLALSPAQPALAAQPPTEAAQTPAELDGYTARARAIVQKMTLDEKIAEVHGIRDAEHYRYVPGLPRLGIPPLRITNGPAGVGPGGAGTQLHATALPAPIALAASWDVHLAHLYGKVAGEETRELGYDLLEGPDVNIIRNPQGGRSFESFSEDPYLDGRIAVGEIEGIQGAGALANVKHFVANNQESDRHAVDEIVGERALREIYLPAFEAAVRDGHVASVMCAYPKVNGEFNCENRQLLTGVIKKDWEFPGFISSDFHAVQSTVPSVLAGLDLELPTGIYFSSALKTAVEQGKVPVSVIDEMLVRRFAEMMRFGLFSARTHPKPVPVFADGRISREIAEQGMVLLKNDSNLLPLDFRTLRSIALIGPGAVQAQSGGGGSSQVIPFYTVQPADGIAAHMLSYHRDLTVLDGSDIAAAVEAAKKAEVAIVMVGDNETEGEDHLIELPAERNKLIAAVAAANPKTIVVLKSGSALLMPWLDAVPAVLEAWYPGEEDGNAVAAVLFGDVNPSGKLPISFPQSVADTFARNPSQYPGVQGTVHYTEGLEVGYRWYQAHNVKPLFPFGYGLSYTTFSFSGLKVTPGPAGGHTAEVSFEVANTGSRAGAEVAELYVGFPPIAEGNEPPRQLKGFRKIMLAPGQSRSVTIPLDARAFSYWSVPDHGWRVAPGSYSIMVGSSSADLPLTATLALQ